MTLMSCILSEKLNYLLPYILGEQSDYEPWVAHWDSSDDIKYKGCLLGRKQTYERLKKNSKCYNGRSKDVTQTAEEKCLCTKDDYDW